MMHAPEGTEIPQLPLEFPQRIPRLALVDVNVVPMDSDRVLRHQTVIVDGGFIVSVGCAGQVSVEGTRVVTCTGKYLMPGLSDMHVHCWEASDVALYLANGVTTIRNMRGAPFHLALQQLVARGVIPGPRIVTTSPLVDGVDSQNQTTRPDSLVLTDPRKAVPLVTRLAARGYQQIKAYERLSPEVLRALGHASAELGLRLTGHCPQGMSYEEAIAAGMSCFEHLTGLATARSMRKGYSGEVLDFDEVERLAELLTVKDVWNCPTLVVDVAAARNLVSERGEVLRYMPRQLRARWKFLARQRTRRAVSIGEHHRALWRECESMGETVRLLHQAGAPLIIGTDARNPFVIPGFSIHEELASFIGAGLTPYQALRCATVEASRFLDESEVWGTVREGKRADLILLDCNPLADLQTLKDPEAVLLNGFFLVRSELRRLLQEREQWARRTERLPGGEDDGWPLAGRSGFTGSLVETSFGEPAARLQFRHSVRPDGGSIIEEHRVHALSGTVASAELHLAPDLILESAEQVVHGPVGFEHLEIRRMTGGGYETWVKEVDGGEKRSVVDETDLFPSDRLSATFVAHALHEDASQESREDRHFQALTVDNGVTGAVSMTLLCVTTKGPPGQVDWLLRIDRAGEPLERVHRIGSAGELLGMAERTPMGQTTWEPDQGTVLAPPGGRSIETR